MPFEKNFAKGSIYPYDAHGGFAYTPCPPKKTLPVVLDSYFLDPITGAYFSTVLFAKVAGNVTLEFLDGSSDTLPILVGFPLHMGAVKVKSTGTTATGLSWGY